jgi:hypothetical protein
VDAGDNPTKGVRMNAPNCWLMDTADQVACWLVAAIRSCGRLGGPLLG